jgi:hypothetical protein
MSLPVAALYPEADAVGLSVMPTAGHINFGCSCPHYCTAQGFFLFLVEKDLFQLLICINTKATCARTDMRGELHFFPLWAES